MTGKRILSGITPSGDGTLHIGNYLGAVRQFIDIARDNDCFLFVADLHALTTIQNKAQLEKNVESLVLNELSLLAGMGSMENVTFFRQSDIFVHTELQSILNNVTPLGLIKRAHAYKDKLEKEFAEDDINMGLFSYPVLMAADILLYKPDFVPVGKDQKQHIEITRDIAERFNKTFGGRKTIFKLPEPFIPEEVASVVGTDGKRKMSKSLGNVISIFEDEAVVKKQVMSCYTDPTRAHANDPGHVDGNMVFTYLEYFGERMVVDEFKEAYTQGKVADVEIKNYLFSQLLKTFEPAREKYRELKANPKMVKDILSAGAEKARSVADRTMDEVRSAIGLVNMYSMGFSRRPLAETLPRHSALQGQGDAFQSGYITIDEFGRMEIRVGKVEKAENVQKSEKLILLTVNFGEFGMRTIYTGVRGYGYAPEDFAGKQFLFVTNLAPRKMPGGESQGMILAVDGLELSFGEHGDRKPVFVPAEGLPVGAKVR